MITFSPKWQPKTRKLHNFLLKIWYCSHELLLKANKKLVQGRHEQTADWHSMNGSAQDDAFRNGKGSRALNLCRTQPDLSTICRFLCLTLLASLIASHFFQSSSLHGPGIKFTGWTLLPTFQDSILRVSISSFLWRKDGDSTRPLLFLSSGIAFFSSKHRNLDRISSGRLHGSGNSAG